MATTGRRPKPTALKRALGNPGKRALNNAEPQPDATMPQAPRWLSREARAEWRRTAKRLHVTGVLTYVDRAVLAAYCSAYGRLAEAEAVLQRDGAVLTTTNGNMIQSPWVGISNKAMEHMVRTARELGLTPASRTSLKVEKPEMELADILFAEVEK